jgi:acyl-CoA thioesterase-1
MNTVGARLLLSVLVVFIVSANSAAAQIVALGASNTQGRGVSPDEAWPTVLESMLHARGSSVHVANAGINGDTTGGELARLDSAVPDGTRVVILNFGRNDFKRGKHGGGAISSDMRQANVAKILSELHRRRIRTIEADGMIDSIRAAGMVQADGIHLTAEGHRRVAARLVGLVR